MNIRTPALIFAAALSLALNSAADIVWSGEQNLSGNVQPIDLNSDSLVDVSISYWTLYSPSLERSNGKDLSNGFLVMLEAYTEGESNLILMDVSNDSSATLSAETVISADTSFTWSGGTDFVGSISDWSTITTPNPDEEWGGLLGDTGDVYLGIAFEVEGATHYGWINITLGEENPSLGFKAPIIASWAYETEADTAIIAGAIPEPSTGILTMVGSLSMLLIARHRRRTQPLTQKRHRPI